MKAIYLDIDGVLNSQDFVESLYKFKTLRRFNLFDQQACLRLVDLVEETGAYIYLSSSWRIDENRSHAVAHQFMPYGLKIAGMTGQEEGQRGDQIAAHLARHPEITQFVVLDDDDDMDAVRDHLVQTTWEHGLQDEHIAKARELLK